MLSGHFVCLMKPETTGPRNRGEQSKNTQVTQVLPLPARRCPLPLEVDLESDLESKVTFD